MVYGSPRRPFVRALALALVCGLPALGGPPGAAADPAADYRLADGNFAGSQIARHEPAAGIPAAAAKAPTTFGHDVSGHQGEIDWSGPPREGAEFVYVKATEGTGYTNPLFAQQYDGAAGAGMVRGAYHFGRPDLSTGRAQAEYFIDHGGGWLADGRTLPGALDIEYNPYGEECYGLTPEAMTAWIKDFSDTYAGRTGRTPALYTSTQWWERCTGGTTTFGGTNPLWIARYATEIGPLPTGWATHAIWQFSNFGRVPGDQNWFNGPRTALDQLARG